VPGSFRTGVTYVVHVRLLWGGYASHAAGTGRHSASRHVTRIFIRSSELRTDF
jgi:hypothetical protein